MNTFVIFLLICFIAYKNFREIAGGEGKCNMTLDDADRCALQLLFIGDKNNLIPTNDNEMSQYCGRMKEGISCIRRYARTCLRPFPQQVFGMFAYDAKTMMRRQCRAEKERSEFIRHVSCFLPKPYMDPLHACVDRYIVQLEIIKAFEPNWRIPGICCTFHLLQDCIRQQTTNLCQSKTGIETADYIMDIINGMTDDVLDFTCGPYKTIEKCESSMNGEEWTKMKHTINIDASQVRQQHRYLSPLPPLVQIITNFEMS